MSTRTKYKTIKESPHKATINKLLIVGNSYAKVAEILKKEYALHVSSKTLNLYHRDELESLIVSGANVSEETPESFEYTFSDSRVKELIDSLTEAENSHRLKEASKELIFEAYTLLSLLSTESLKRHMRGQCRFPNDYLTKLVSMFGIIAK